MCPPPPKPKNTLTDRQCRPDLSAGQKSSYKWTCLSYNLPKTSRPLCCKMNRCPFKINLTMCPVYQRVDNDTKLIRPCTKHWFTTFSMRPINNLSLSKFVNLAFFTFSIPGEAIQDRKPYIVMSQRCCNLILEVFWTKFWITMQQNPKLLISLRILDVRQSNAPSQEIIS